MRKTKFFFTIIILLFSCGFARSSTESVQIKIIAAEANIYLEPNENSTVMETVVKGEVLDISGTGESTENWYNVFYKSERWGARISGFVKSSMAEIVGRKIEKKEVIHKEVVEREKSKITEEQKKEVVKVEKQAKEEVKKEKKKEKGIEKPVKAEKVQEIKPETEYETIEEPKIKRKEIGPKIGFGLTGGYAMPSEDNYKGGISYGGILHLGITKNIAFELSGLRFQSEVERDPDKLSKGDLTITTILMSIQLRFQVGSVLVPYLAGGGSYYLNDFSIDNKIKEDWDLLGFDINEEVESSFGFHVGGGFDIFLSDHIAFNGDVKYCIVNSKGTWTFSNQMISQEVSGDFDSINLNSLIFGVSLKIFF